MAATPLPRWRWGFLVSSSEDNMFPLLRYFSITSLFTVVVILIVLGVQHNASDKAHMVKMTQLQNVELARAFANSVWPRYSDFVAKAEHLTPEAIRSSPESAAMGKDLMRLSWGLPVLKIKIYSLHGRTIFSSDSEDIGQTEMDTSAFAVTALNGMPLSRLRLQRDEHADDEIHFAQRDFVESYLPIRTKSGQVEGVFELFSDVTPWVDEISSTTNKLHSWLIVLFGILYAILFCIVRHADGRLKRQYAALENEIAERERVEQQLEQALAQVRTSARIQQNFVADAAHELRTPLAVLKAQLEAFSPDAEFVGDIGEDLERGTRLVNQLVDAARHNSTQLGDMSSVDMVAVASEVIRSLAPLAVKQNKTISLTAEDGPVYVLGMHDALTGALRNLVENALAYTAAGTNVDVGIARDGTISVADQGAGIPEVERTMVFRRFWRGSNSHGKIGSGLGLAIVSEIVRSHGGTITIGDNPRGGTIFTMKLKAAAPAPVMG